MTIEFFKYHGLGNDYIVIDPNLCPNQFQLTPKNIQLICNRNLGIGSDGILYGPITQENGSFALRIYNPDGSEAEKSGNGMRIFAYFLSTMGYVNKQEFQFNLDISGEIIHAKIINTDPYLITLNMGKYLFGQYYNNGNTQERIVNKPINIDGKEIYITCVNVGNPHCVIIKDHISLEETKHLGPLIENHPLFYNRVNVQFVQVIDKDNIKIHIWERGAGYTLASGSSSTAAACVTSHLQLTNKELTVHMPGGSASLSVRQDDVLLTGTVSSIMRGEMSEEFFNQLISI